MTLASTLAQRPDAERVRLRLGTAFVEHASDLWPEGDAPDVDAIRAHAFDILGLLPLRGDGKDVRRLPPRLHFILWLLDDLDT